jgi:hypothetical protein
MRLIEEGCDRLVKPMLNYPSCSCNTCALVDNYTMGLFIALESIYFLMGVSLLQVWIQLHTLMLLSSKRAQEA